MQPRFDISSCFEKAHKVKEDKILEQVYQYRSNIAHGNKHDFETKKGNMTLLGDEQSIDSFIEHLTHKLLIYSLMEPELLVDLREC